MTDAGATDQPRRTDPAATEAATRRLAALLDDLARVELGVLVIPPPDDVRGAAHDRAVEAAIAAGRGDLLAGGRRAAREAATRSFAQAAYSGTWAATEMAASVTRPADRVAAASAFEDAAIAAVAADLVDRETLDVLREPTDLLQRATGLPPPGSLSGFSTPAARLTTPLQVALAIAVVAVGVVMGFVANLGFGLLMIVGGLALLGAIARRRSAPGA